MRCRKPWFVTITALVAASCMEAVAWVAIGLYLQREERIFHRPLLKPTDDDIRTYIRVRDERLGWVPRWDVDPDGSRVTTVFPYGSLTCVSLYGDSFAWGAEVSAAEGYEWMADGLAAVIGQSGLSVRR